MTNLLQEDFAARVAYLTRRYNGTTLEALVAVLCPLLIPIHTLDKRIEKLIRQSHYRASFTLRITDQNRAVIQRGRTGKFVPRDYGQGGINLWKEVAKGRIVELDPGSQIAIGEVYTGGGRDKLVRALDELDASDYLEIDQYGAAAKVLSGLAEYHLAENLQAADYAVARLPEDMARHLGAYENCDFVVTKGGLTKRVEVKSLWGTNTEYARLIHSTTKRPSGDSTSWTAEQEKTYYPTSSCKFETQDIFAVSLFLRTGNIRDFAFARSVPIDVKAYGLPRASAFPDHVNQNPRCQIGDGVWFGSMNEVWSLE